MICIFSVWHALICIFSISHAPRNDLRAATLIVLQPSPNTAASRVKRTISFLFSFLPLRRWCPRPAWWRTEWYPESCAFFVNVCCLTSWYTRPCDLLANADFILTPRVTVGAMPRVTTRRSSKETTPSPSPLLCPLLTGNPTVTHPLGDCGRVAMLVRTRILNFVHWPLRDEFWYYHTSGVSQWSAQYSDAIVPPGCENNSLIKISETSRLG